MSDQTPANPVFQIQRVYLKEASLEQPNSPAILLEQEQPSVDIQLGVEASPVTDGIFEVAVTATVHTKIKDKTVFLADTTVNERPTANELADIAEGTVAVARRMGHDPRVAFLSYSTFGNPPGKWLENIRAAVALLDERQPGFEYEGEMAPDAALNPTVMKNYPFSRLSAPANVLIMPGLQSANISAKLLRELVGNTTIGPMLLGMEKPVQIVPLQVGVLHLTTPLVPGGAAASPIPIYRRTA